MKTGRWFTQAAAVVLTGMLLAAGVSSPKAAALPPPASEPPLPPSLSPGSASTLFNLPRPWIHTGPRTFLFGSHIALKYRSSSLADESSTQRLATALGAQIQEVRKTFDINRRTLHPVTTQGKPAYYRPEVAELIAHTKEDLDKAIDHIRPAKMDPLRAWAADAIESIQDQLAPPPGQIAASFHSAFTPRAVAVVASLGRLSLPWLASVTAGPQQDTVLADTSDQLLDQVENVINRILFLASHDDLEVKLWVGTSVPHATFSFGPQSRIKGATPAVTNIRTDGSKDHVLRGLYTYRATYSEGTVAQLVQYPTPADAPADQTPSERLDLVNGSSFFCCRFKEQYCGHVDMQHCS